ncbi:hypothetical protein [Actinoallomurus sp. NPDC050550]|uniref:hypothetical protein n=1 Tax=Actinoallomurus sp. NPDC050550 TaxID=3154937 RepID=UPI0033FB7118
MTEIVHLFVRPDETGGGFYVTSPQAPGLVYGEPSLEAVRQGIQDVLAFHFDRPGPFRIVEHHERRYDLAGGELVTRMAYDEHIADRQIVYERIGAALGVPGQAQNLVSAPTNKVGEVVYVCAVATDTLGWLGDQLDPRSSDAFMVAASVSDALLFAVAFARGEGYAEEGELILAEPDMTVADVIRKTAIVGPAPSQHPTIRVPA